MKNSTEILQLADTLALATLDPTADPRQPLEELAAALSETGPTEPDPRRDPLALAAVEAKFGADTDAERFRILREAVDPFRPVAEWADEEPPEPVLWGEGGPHRTVLRRGEVAILASAGGLGKSFLTLRWALRAADGGGEAAGFGVADGPAVLIGYEDSAGEVARRLGRMREADGRSGEPIPDRLRILPDPPPLYQSDPEARGKAIPCARWGAIFGAVRALRPALVIVDPASAALADASPSDTGPVRSFMGALRREAEAGDFGALIVAHDTKAARNAAAAGEAPGAGAIAGSAAWFDAARAALHMWRDPSEPEARIVESVKANYGRTGWAVRLREKLIGPTRTVFAGLRCVGTLDRDGVADSRRPPPKRSPKRNGAAAAYPDGFDPEF